MYSLDLALCIAARVLYNLHRLSINELESLGSLVGLSSPEYLADCAENVTNKIALNLIQSLSFFDSQTNVF